MEQVFECDVAVIGGGLGGAAAALAAVESGMQVVLTESTDWIGGQVTSQAVSALDEHQYNESFGGTRSYGLFREAVRKKYIHKYGGPAKMPDGQPLNPGNGWVSRLCFEPRVGLQVLEDMLTPYALSGRLVVLLNHTPQSVRMSNARIQEVRLSSSSGETVVVKANYFLDATETGDLLPLSSTPYSTGSEAVEDTGEPHASSDGPHPDRTQSFTWCFLVENRAGENHIIKKPVGYEAVRDEQPFTLSLASREGNPRRFYMFGGDLPFWTYRRVLDANLFQEAGVDRAPRHDIALINWDANDYYKENILNRSPAQKARIFHEAKRLSLSFLYWLQTEAPHDSGKSSMRGYPGLKLLPEATGTPDGLAKAPYIRESRRVTGLKRIVEQDIVESPGRGARAAHFNDTVGIGWYPIDLHRCAGDPTHGLDVRHQFGRSLPFQIPLGALLSPAVDNLIMAAKNIATTHITNGAYRLHPVEWNVGESAGALAAFCSIQKIKPCLVREDMFMLQRFQAQLLNRGIPLFWSLDLPLHDRDFATIQSILISSPPPNGSLRRERLQVLPDEQISHSEAEWLMNSHPRARSSDLFANHLARWRASPFDPLTPEELRSGLDSIDVHAALSSIYPNLRQLCICLTRPETIHH